MKFLKKHWLIILIVLTSLIVRVYRIEATMTFLEDEGRDLLIVKRMLDTRRPVLLGPQTSTGNMYLGPLYYYFITPALVLSRMDPVGPALLIALTGVLTTYLLYVLGKKWFSPRAGYLGAIMFAVLPMSVMVTRASWNPNLVPLITTMMLLSYDQVIKKSRPLDYLIYGGLVGIMVQLHYMALIFCAVLSLAILINQRSRWSLLLRGTALSFVGFILMLMPFIIFEIRNDGVNTKAIARYIQAKEERNIRYDLPLWLWWNKVGKTSYRLIGNTLVGSEMGVQKATPLVVALSSALVLLTLLLSLKKKKWQYLRLFVIFVASMSILGIYQESIHLHYIEFALVLVIMLLAGIFQKSSPRALISFTLFMITLILLLGGKRTLEYVNSGETHQVEKVQKVASYIVQKAEGKPYNVVSTQGVYTTPFQYFLALSNNPPVKTLTPLVFDICEGGPCPLDDETTTLLFLTGPGHPAISQYLGHPELNSFAGKRKMISNEHVSIGIWVAEIMLE